MQKLRRFLDMINFYRRSLPKSADIQATLHNLAENSTNSQIPWTPETENAFLQLKSDLAIATLHHHHTSGLHITIYYRYTTHFCKR